MRIFISDYLLCLSLKPVIAMLPAGVQDWFSERERLPSSGQRTELEVKLQVVCLQMREEIFDLVLNSVVRKLHKSNTQVLADAVLLPDLEEEWRAESTTETLHLEFKLESLWQQCFQTLLATLSLFTAVLIWLIMHYVFHIGSRIPNLLTCKFGF